MIASPRDMRTIDTIIDSLGYDYARFDIDHFVRYIESLRRHEILVNHVPLDSDLFGIWCPALNRDYVFINDRLYVAHRIHSLLHEIAHMVLDHQGQDLRKVLRPELLAALGISPERGHLRGVSSGNGDDSPEDKEAEIFVSLIRRRLAAAQRLHELGGCELASFMNTVDRLWKSAQTANLCQCAKPNLYVQDPLSVRNL